jgi:hypothetical protein
MRKTLGILAALAALGWAGAARASDPIGAYVVVDKVVLEPNAESPTRIQIWGAFSLAKVAGGASYNEPVRGYLYYRLAEGKEDVCRREWADLRRAAGTGQVIGMGSSFDRAALGAVRLASEKAANPDPYPVAMGLERVRGNTDYPPVRDLVTLPAPLAPADGATVDPGKVTLTARNILGPAHARAKYVFELQSASGEKEVSPEVTAGDKETKWTPRLEVKAGEKYTWRVRASEGRWKGPVATSAFQGKARP